MSYPALSGCKAGPQPTGSCATVQHNHPFPLTVNVSETTVTAVGRRLSAPVPLETPDYTTEHADVCLECGESDYLVEHPEGDRCRDCALMCEQCDKRGAARWVAPNDNGAPCRVCDGCLAKFWGLGFQPVPVRRCRFQEVA